MANHAHSTRTPLLPQDGPPSALLARGAGRQPGPVTLALRAMHPNEAHSWEIRQAQVVAEERAALRALRVRISTQFAADAALLEGIDA